MRIEQVVAHLQHHHREIETSLREGQALLDDGDASQLKAIALVRWQLMRALRAYQLFKHTEIFNPIIASGALPRAREAEDLKQRCILIGEAYQEHVKQWSLSGPAHSWPTYIKEAQEIIRRIRTHLNEETLSVEALIANLKRTRQRE